MTRTDPMLNSAPLPADQPIDWVDPKLIHAEIVRAQAELMHAIDKHRRCWTKMARMKAVAEVQGNAYFMDNDRAWKIATSDVTWWRGEVNTRSNSLMALIQLARLMDLKLGPKWAETTAFGESGTTRTFMRADPRPRQICLCNTPPPTVDQPKNGTASRPPGWFCPRHGEVI